MRGSVPQLLCCGAASPSHCFVSLPLPALFMLCVLRLLPACTALNMTGSSLGWDSRILR